MPLCRWKFDLNSARRRQADRRNHQENMMTASIRSFIAVALLTSFCAEADASATELCHSAVVGQARMPIKFCVDPAGSRVTRYTASAAQVERFDQQRSDVALEGILTLRAGRLDPPLRITSKYLLQDLPSPTLTLGQKGQAAYQICSWNSLLDASCARQDPGRGPARCWKPCSNWYGYMPGTESND
jgi:hypothetical protein